MPVPPAPYSSSYPLRLFFYCYRPHRDLHSFPTRRSSDLSTFSLQGPRPGAGRCTTTVALLEVGRLRGDLQERDRKSTRLNSSHPSISYAVFCLKKKKTRGHEGARQLLPRRLHPQLLHWHR